MTYTLENLAKDCNPALKDDPGPAGRDKMARHLETALKDPEFVLERPATWKARPAPRWRT